MEFVPELQDPLDFLSIENTLDQELKITIRKTGGRKDPDSPIGRSGWDVLSYPFILAPTAHYEIYFPEFITYCVTDQSRYVADSGSVGEGSTFCRFSKSRFLDFVESTTYGKGIHPGPRFHYGIFCQNACIEIVTCKAPSIHFLGDSAR